MPYELHQGDALTRLAAIPSNSIDAVITDPPYNSGGRTAQARTGRADLVRGLAAAAVQCAHVFTRVTPGYSGTYESGFPDEHAFEEWLARLDQLCLAPGARFFTREQPPRARGLLHFRLPIAGSRRSARYLQGRRFEACRPNGGLRWRSPFGVTATLSRIWSGLGAGVRDPPGDSTRKRPRSRAGWEMHVSALGRDWHRSVRYCVTPRGRRPR